jgi:hypothetical protein
MRRDRGVLIFLLVITLVFGLALGMNQVWAQPEEEEEEEVQPRPNPTERPADTSKPVLLMKKGSTSWDPTDKTGASGRTMKPGEEVMDDGRHGDGIIFLEDGRKGMMQKGAGGKMQFFLLQGSSQVLAPDGAYPLSDGSSITVSAGQASNPIDPVTMGGAVKSPDQMQMPGKMR